MTRDKWDQRLAEARERINSALRSRPSDEFIEELAIFEVEFVHGPRETCEQPPAKGLLDS